MPQAVTISFYRFASLRDRVWAFAMMALAPRRLRQVPDLGFWKLCGSGTGEGFTPVPNTAVFAILATWPDADTARRRIASALPFTRYRARAVEDWTVILTPTAARGDWSGRRPFDPAPATSDGPLAALTRATIRPRRLWRFWRRVPEISRMIGRDPDVAFKIGIGEIPWLHQVTFSIWPDAAAMARFARRGHHAEAIRAVREGDWFREELYARFAIHSDLGTWNGTSPLAALEAS
ncbi:spheroidene monooxygenase [Jannaschia sp. S6380]|uniref:spheroidene monooxygenase n=1 Tax=Jannaschia sp. S6380 TaxID=2926408 RepID=UPI001FF634F4|nr:spheroidene monooxygenase [Jannaschia sp. S6380]MCK0167688.1 spheroidene monooxygenase [Jannaschia sp. S6380]